MTDTLIERLRAKHDRLSEYVGTDAGILSLLAEAANALEAKVKIKPLQWYGSAMKGKWTADSLGAEYVVEAIGNVFYAYDTIGNEIGAAETQHQAEMLCNAAHDARIRAALDTQP